MGAKFDFLTDDLATYMYCLYRKLQVDFTKVRKSEKARNGRELQEGTHGMQTDDQRLVTIK